VDFVSRRLDNVSGMPVQDRRSSHGWLSAMYGDLLAGDVEFSHELPNIYASQVCPTNGVRLSADETAQFCADSAKLCATDRVASYLKLEKCLASATYIQLLLKGDSVRLNRSIGRLKSRSASLLLKNVDRRNSTKIWGKGFWFANLKTDAAYDAVSAFMENH